MRFPAFWIVCPPVVFILAGLWLPMHAQSFLNGNFELNSIDSCGINLQNSYFNSKMPYVTAFGAKNEVDLLSSDCQEGAAAEGDFFVALNSEGGITDALALLMKQPVEIGKVYQFAFYMKSGNETYANLQFGLSDTPDQFGTLIYTSESPGFSWKSHRVEYLATVEAQYLTIRLDPTFPSWVFLDAIELVCPAQFSLGPDTTLCEVDGYPLEVPIAYETYFWQNGSTDAAILAEEPGWYWVEASSPFCSYRDSVLLQEFTYSCDCEIYQANAFSPNFDGVNDEFLLPSGCRYAAYFLQITDRWGNIVFYSDNPDEGWDGRWRGARAAHGVYLYHLVYQFEYQSEQQQMSGDVLLIH